MGSIFLAKLSGMIMNLPQKKIEQLLTMPGAVLQNVREQLTVPPVPPETLIPLIPLVPWMVPGAP